MKFLILVLFASGILFGCGSKDKKPAPQPPVDPPVLPTPPEPVPPKPTPEPEPPKPEKPFENCKRIWDCGHESLHFCGLDHINYRYPNTAVYLNKKLIQSGFGPALKCTVMR